MKFNRVTSVFVITLLSILQLGLAESSEDSIEEGDKEVEAIFGEIDNLIPKDIMEKFRENCKDMMEKVEGDSEEMKFMMIAPKMFKELIKIKTSITDESKRKKFEELLEKLYNSAKKGIDETSELNDEKKQKLKKDLDEAYNSRNNPEVNSKTADQETDSEAANPETNSKTTN
ncbi:MAG: hypothetical protein KC414_14660 [Romboutsia sp.]|nr:hypothetical protein [Romboutsia sp.]